MLAASERATTSVGPPAAKGTTKEIGREGQTSWATAVKVVNEANASALVAIRFLHKFINNSVFKIVTVTK
jgi:hypothetical protein